MYSYETKIRIRYGDIDKMGYCYYGNYPLFYETGRTELMRSLGYTYGRLEDKGILMPVLNMHVNYFQPAFYDDEITVKTTITEMPVARIRFVYELFNVEGKLINKGETTLAFLNEKTRKPMRAPAEIINRLTPYFN